MQLSEYRNVKPGAAGGVLSACWLALTAADKESSNARMVFVPNILTVCKLAIGCFFKDLETPSATADHPRCWCLYPSRLLPRNPTWSCRDSVPVPGSHVKCNHTTAYSPGSCSRPRRSLVPCGAYPGYVILQLSDWLNRRGIESRKHSLKVSGAGFLPREYKSVTSKAAGGGNAHTIALPMAGVLSFSASVVEYLRSRAWFVTGKGLYLRRSFVHA